MADKRGDRLDWTGTVRCLPERLDWPVKWRQPRRVFVCSMADLFHEDVPTEFILRVFEVMAGQHQHIFQVLTKRPERMLRLLVYGDKMACDSPEHHRLLCMMPLPNIWLGVTAENQEMWRMRVDILRQIPAVVHFVSYEPALGSLGDVDLTDIDWVIAGGETGPGARPAHPDWFRSLRDQCTSAGVAFWFKQRGEWAWEYPEAADLSHMDETYLAGTHFYHVGRRRAGHLLDGREWKELPSQSG